jgi:FkbM family methyltransferase
MPGYFRSIVERAARKFVFKRRLPEQFGSVPIYASSEGGLRYFFKPMGAVDPVLLSLVEEVVFPGAIVWDIGANIGLFSFAAAAKAGAQGKIIAFEPDIWLVQLLRKSLSLQDPEKVSMDIIPAAAGAEVDIRTFCIANRARASNFLKEYGASQTGGVRTEYKVITLSLDWLMERLAIPHILKIDAEGAEVEIIRGGLTLIKKARPIIICEIGGDANAALVSEMLSPLGYSFYDAEEPAHLRKKKDKPVWSTLALPG